MTGLIVFVSKVRKFLGGFENFGQVQRDLSPEKVWLHTYTTRIYLAHVITICSLYRQLKPSSFNPLLTSKFVVLNIYFVPYDYIHTLYRKKMKQTKMAAGLYH